MKNLFIYLLLILFSGCNLFPGKIYGIDKSPSHDIRTFGSYIKEINEDYHIFSKIECGDGYIQSSFPDTLTVNGKLYRKVFFVHIIPSKLDKDFRNLNIVQCSLREIFSKGDTLRKSVPGFGNRKFLVVDNVVGVK